VQVTVAVEEAAVDARFAADRRHAYLFALGDGVVESLDDALAAGEHCVHGALRRWPALRS
jgi:hypothetical protein